MALAKVIVTAAPALTPREAFEARARQLAERKHLLGTARYHGTSTRGHWLLSVPSEDRTREYVVRHDPESGHYVCQCPAGAFERACGHVGAVLHWQDARVSATATAADDEAWRHWLNGGQW